MYINRYMIVHTINISHEKQFKDRKTYSVVLLFLYILHSHPKIIAMIFYSWTYFSLLRPAIFAVAYKSKN